jgi:hypothetical protein
MQTADPGRNFGLAGPHAIPVRTAGRAKGVGRRL